jgi:dihydrofolate reductase
MRNASKVSTGFSMSLDGFVAGPNEAYFEHLFAWMASGDTDYTITIGDQEQKLKLDAPGVETFDDATNTTGALVAGRRLYEITNGWGGHHPVGAPVVVVTHRPPPDWVKADWPVTFVIDGLESAIAQARAIAGDKSVVVASAKELSISPTALSSNRPLTCLLGVGKGEETHLKGHQGGEEFGCLADPVNVGE